MVYLDTEWDFNALQQMACTPRVKETSEEAH